MIDRYKDKDISTVWNRLSTYQRWHRVEVAWLKAMNDRSIRITFPECMDVWENLSISIPAIEAREAIVHHDVSAFVDVMQASFYDNSRAKGVDDQPCINHANSYHFALTSSDVVDTATSLAFQESFQHVRNGIHTLRMALSTFGFIKRSDRFCISEPFVIARTHGEVAGVIDVSQKTSRYIEQLNMTFHRTNQLDFFGKFTGPLGLSTGFEDQYDVHRNASIRLGLTPVQSSTQVIPRSVFSGYMFELALLGRTLAAIAIDLRLMISQKEITLKKSDDIKGSSSMPHKVNPVELEKVCGMARLLSGYLSSSLENVEIWGERDMSHSSVDRLTFEDAFHLVMHMMLCIEKTIEKCEVNSERVREVYGDHSRDIVSYEVIHWILTKSKGVTRDTIYTAVKHWAATGDSQNIRVILDSEDLYEEFATKYQGEL